MRIGYPCINTGIGCTANSTFRLSSYCAARMMQAITNNISCLFKMLEYNSRNGLLFFRIGSGFVPFASHPVCRFAWQRHFIRDFRRLGVFAKNRGFRISMHPDQFVVLNSPNKKTVSKSVKEIEYHCALLDIMGLGRDAKVQVHVGGLYSDRDAAISRFCRTYRLLSPCVRKRLVIENDERLFPLQDCIQISRKTGVPVVFDSFHHECNNNGEPVRKALEAAAGTWKKSDGMPMVDYSSQQKGRKTGAHASTIKTAHFSSFLQETAGMDFDIMLEIKDKQKSALKALAIARTHKSIGKLIVS